MADRPGIGDALAEAVSAGAEDMQFGGHPGALEAQIRLRDPLGDVRSIVVGGEQERRRRVPDRLDARRAPGIDQDLEIGARREPGDRIRRSGVAGVEARAGQRDQLPAGGRCLSTNAAMPRSRSHSPTA